MLLTKDTTIYALTSKYPFLVDALAARNKDFEKLKNPLLRQSVGRIASVEKAAAMGGEDLLALLLFLAGEIMTATGESVEITPPATAKTGGEKISQEERLARLKDIIRELHDGADFGQLQDKFTRTVGDISPEEIASLEQTLVNEGLPESEIKKMCHLHAALFQNALEGQEMPPVQPGHPIHTYMQENARARPLIDAIRRGAGGDGGTASTEHLSALVQELSGILTHYVRKENQLFPLLERHDLTAPGKVMWEVHDDIRQKFRRTRELLEAENRSEAAAALHDLAAEVEEMIRKEENILFPMSLKLLNEEDWDRCRLGDDEIGYAFGVSPGNQWSAPAVTENAAGNFEGGIALSTGVLSQEVLDAILRSLPVDISFVGADDRVAYYSDSAHRIFPRSAAVIGREVRNCHPSKSVHVVTEILDAFRKEEQEKAEFWLELGGKFIHIQYLAIRNAQGEYLGCLEIGQDATRLRSLTGQRRLLEWK